MAFVDGTITISFEFVDDDLAEARTSVKLPEGTAYDDAITYASGYVTLIKAVSDCALTGYTVTQNVYDDAYPVGAAGSDVEDKGVLTIRTQGNGTSTLAWPGILESLLVNTITPAGTYINLANVAVAALIAALINGIGGIQPSDRRGFDFLSVKEGYKQQRGSLASREYRG
jgi:hypothetical protein